MRHVSFPVSLASTFLVKPCALPRQTDNETLRRTSDPGPSPFGYGPPTDEQTRHATQGRRCAEEREKGRERRETYNSL